MTEYFAIHTISEDEGEDDDWVTFDPRHQLGGGLWHLTKADAMLLYRKMMPPWRPICNLDMSFVCSREEIMEAVRQWAWTCNMQKHIIRAAVFLDVGNVLSELSHTQLLRLHCDLRTQEMTNVGIYICTRGTKRWRELLQYESLYQFCSLTDGVLITRYLERDPRINPCLYISHPTRTPFHFLSLENGDKGDCAQVLRVPCLLFDDKRDNLQQVRAKGSAGSNGVLVTRRRNPRTVPGQTHVADVWQWPGIVLRWLANLPH